MRAILKRHRKIFLGDGNAVPAPARGVVCDLDVGDAKPITLRPRSIGPHVAVKVYELLKKLLENNLIEHSEAQWASTIVIVLKQNGVDIRMCIDYRLVNNFIELSSYLLPLIDDLLVGFEKALWFMSLDMASGFWAIKMTERVKLISAFVCPFGHFQWIRMPFGLKNAPLIYQQVVNNCLWGFVRLPPEEEAEVDQEVLDYLDLDLQDDGPPGRGTPGYTGCEDDHVPRALPTLADQMTVFKRNTPAPIQMLRYWNISVSLPKSEFGKLSIPYVSHEISAEGIRATPKIAKGVQDLPFPTTLKGVQSFLGSLNYYHKFIEDYTVVAASLYELSDDQVRSGRDLSRAKQAFEILKHKIVSTPPVRFTGRVLHDAEL
ncbi:reverse transcriptase, partial [Phytophthora megakarya]